MKERNAKVLEIILRTICIASLLFLFICNSIKPTVICFICYFLYKTIKEVIFYVKRIKQKEIQKAAYTILLSERVICYIILIVVLLHYLL